MNCPPSGAPEAPGFMVHEAVGGLSLRTPPGAVCALYQNTYAESKAWTAQMFRVKLALPADALLATDGVPANSCPMSISVPTICGNELQHPPVPATDEVPL